MYDAGISSLAERLDSSQRLRNTIRDDRLFDGLTLGAAYRVQHALIERRMLRHDPVVGLKLGFTSQAKMQQMGVHSPILGTLTASMQVHDGATVHLNRFIHPRIEPEVAFRLSRDVEPDASLTTLLDSVDAVAPALEIIDSRFEGFSFTLSSVVADNTSAAGFAVGAWQPFGLNTPLKNLAVQMIVADQMAAIGSTAAILGDPLRIFPLLLQTAREHGFALPAGSIILAGAATAAVPLTPGLAEARVAGLGRVAITAVGESDE